MITTQSATIANGESLSSAVDLDNGKFVGIIMPAAWTAAAITLAVSDDGVTYYPLFDDGGNEVTITVAAGEAISSTTSGLLHLAYWNFVKFRSGTSGTPVNQGAARTIKIVFGDKDSR